MKKRVLSLVLAVALLCAMLPYTAQPVDAAAVDASGSCGTKVSWELTGGTLTIYGTGAMFDYSMGNHPWTSTRTTIHTVVVEEGVTALGQYAFYYFNNLKDVVLPVSLKTVAKYAFYKAEKITDVYYDGTAVQWTKVSVNATGNEGLTAAAFHEQAYKTVASGECGENALWTLTGRGKLTIAGSGDMTDFTKSNQPWAAYRQQIKLVEVKSGIESIGNYSFYYCKNLRTISIPESVTNIGKYAARSAAGLKDVNYASSAAIWERIVVPTGNDKLMSAALHSVEPTITGLEIAKLPNKVAYLQGEPLDLTGLTLSVTNANGSTSKVTAGYTIYGYNPNSLKTQTITVIYKGMYVTFDVNVRAEGTCGAEGDNIKWTVTDTVLELTGTGKMADYTNATSPFRAKYMNDIKTVKVGEGITYLGKRAFYYLIKVGTARLPLSLEKIGDGAFYKTKTVINKYFAGTEYQWSFVEVAKNNETLNAAQLRCETIATLTGIEMTNEPTQLSYAGGEELNLRGMVVVGLYDDGSTKILPHSSIKTTGYNAANPKTQSITVKYGSFTIENAFEVTVTAEGTCDNGMMWSIEEGVLSVYGEGAMETYGKKSNLAPWKDYRNYITGVVFGEGITSIGEYAMYYCKKLTDVTIPASVTAVAANAFSGATATDVYYEGTEEQWAQVSVGSGNTALTDAAMHFDGAAPEPEVVLTGITVTAPSKTGYTEGEELELDGMTVTAVYSDGTTAEVSEGFTVTGFDTTALGEQVITVTYEGFTGTFTVTVAAAEVDDGTTKLVVEQVQASAGQTVEVKLSVKNNPGILGMMFSVEFDESVLTLTDSYNGEATGNLTYLAPSNLVSGANYLWYGVETGEVVDGSVLTLVFHVAEGAAAGSTPIRVLYSEADTYDASYNTIAATVVDGAVIVK